MLQTGHTPLLTLSLKPWASPPSLPSLGKIIIRTGGSDTPSRKPWARMLPACRSCPSIEDPGGSQCLPDAQTNRGTGLRHHQIGDGLPAVLTARLDTGTGGMEPRLYGLEFKTYGRIASKLRRSRVKLGKFRQNQAKIDGYAVKKRENCRNQKNQTKNSTQPICLTHEKFGQLRQPARRLSHDLEDERRGKLEIICVVRQNTVKVATVPSRDPLSREVFCKGVVNHGALCFCDAQRKTKERAACGTSRLSAGLGVGRSKAAAIKMPHFQG